jgi:hypothetical protein
VHIYIHIYIYMEGGREGGEKKKGKGVGLREGPFAGGKKILPHPLSFFTLPLSFFALPLSFFTTFSQWVPGYVCTPASGVQALWSRQDGHF